MNEVRSLSEAPLFDAIKRFVAEISSGERQVSTGDSEDIRLSYAALLVHAASVDGGMSEEERERLEELLMQRFELDRAAATQLAERAVVADEQAVDLYRFTRLLNEKLDEPGRLRMIENMWSVALADGAPSDYENNLIWRVADLLGVSTSERVALRQRAAAALGAA